VVTLAEVGGAQSYVRDLLPAATEEFDVTVAAHGNGPLRTACVQHGVTFVPLEHVRRELSPRDLVGLAELYRLFRRLRPDIVHLNSSKAGVLGRLAAAAARVPIRVFTAHGWAFNGTSERARGLYLRAERLVSPLTTMTVCVSEADRRSGVEAGTCTDERSTVIPNAVDVAAALPRNGAARSRVEIVSVGRLAEQKNFPALIAAASLLPPGRAHVCVLGDGPQRPLLDRLIADAGLEQTVDLHGEVSDVRPFLAGADVFVLSTHFEGMPISLLEAMAASLPIVASDVNGLDEVVIDGTTGFLVPPDDPAALAAALRRLIDDPVKRRAFGQAAHERALERFSLQRWRDDHPALYASLLHAPAPSAGAA
jgi:glycosyltransferase involved in cell wall biosynthesis